MWFFLLIWKQICCYFSGLIFWGVQMRARIYMWSFSLQDKTNLTVVHLWGLWVWSRSRFSESINDGVLCWKGRQRIWTESLRGWCSLERVSAAEDQQPVICRLPLQFHPISREVWVWNAKATFSDFPLTSSTECTFCVWTENFITFFILLISPSLFRSLHKAENTGKEKHPEGPSV